MSLSPAPPDNVVETDTGDEPSPSGPKIDTTRDSFIDKLIGQTFLKVENHAR
jgi:hypothetical protein